MQREWHDAVDAPRVRHGFSRKQSAERPGQVRAARVLHARDRVGERIVVMDTGVFSGHQRMTSAWIAFRDFVERTEDLPVSMLVKGACATDPGADVVAA